jgi:hypothetical protein
LILGLFGCADSGKGTVGNIISKKFPYIRESFAGLVKDVTSTMFGWERKLLEGDTEESRIFRETKDEWWSEKLGFDLTPRYGMQLIGTESMRERIHSKIWIFALERKIDLTNDYFITDVRFPNEMDWIKSLGGVNVNITREDPKWYWDAWSDNRRNTTKMIDNHPNVHYSEWAHIGYSFDYHIENNSTIDNLSKKVDSMFTFFETTKDFRLDGR